MKALDTNILLRYLLQDDPKQSLLANRFIESATADDRRFINAVTLNETVWALKKIYGIGKTAIADTLHRIMETEQLQIENAEAVAVAIKHYRNHNIDFADALIGAINRQAGYAKTATFDKKAAQLNEFELLS